MSCKKNEKEKKEENSMIHDTKCSKITAQQEDGANPCKIFEDKK
jgi:hypothetical protein